MERKEEVKAELKHCIAISSGLKTELECAFEDFSKRGQNKELTRIVASSCDALCLQLMHQLPTYWRLIDSLDIDSHRVFEILIVKVNMTIMSLAETLAKVQTLASSPIAEEIDPKGLRKALDKSAMHSRVLLMNLKAIEQYWEKEAEKEIEEEEITE